MTWEPGASASVVNDQGTGPDIVVCVTTTVLIGPLSTCHLRLKTIALPAVPDTVTVDVVIFAPLAGDDMVTLGGLTPPYMFEISTCDVVVRGLASAETWIV